MKTIRQIIQVSVVTLFILSMSVSVEAITGNKLIEYCESYGVEKKTPTGFQKSAWCTGYILGVVSGMIYLDFKNQFCIPSKNVTNEQITKVVIKYLKENPQRLHEIYTSLIFTAISEAFPCKQN
jgi:hypothetical protein